MTTKIEPNRRLGYLAVIANLYLLFCHAFIRPMSSTLSDRALFPRPSRQALGSDRRQRTCLRCAGETIHEHHDRKWTDREILRLCEAWVQSMIADFDVCPYTANASTAGLPLAPIRYTISNATTTGQAIDDYWSEIFHLLATNEKEVSTVLLVFPRMDLFRSFDKFDELGLQLEDALSESKLNGIEFDNVFFHPEYKFIDKDAQAYILFDEATGEPKGLSSYLLDPVSYSRRSPWPIVNILRSPFVKLVQKNMPEGRVFQRNRQRLTEIGNEVLQDMLEKKDWTHLPIIKSRLK